MPLKLNVGVSKKIGLPEYSSVGASCHLEVELDPGLLQTELDGFHDRVKSAYVAGHQAVHDEADTPAGPARRASSRDRHHRQYAQRLFERA